MQLMKGMAKFKQLTALPEKFHKEAASNSLFLEIIGNHIKYNNRRIRV
jgi:hypothetical protein